MQTTLNMSELLTMVKTEYKIPENFDLKTHVKVTATAIYRHSGHLVTHMRRKRRVHGDGAKWLLLVSNLLTKN